MSAKVKSNTNDEPYLPVFAYGTLMYGFSNHVAHFGETKPVPGTNLSRAEKLDELHMGNVTGYRMLDLGSFPMAVPGVTDDDEIRGHLMTIKPEHYDNVLASLDRLEGYSKGSKKNFYEREIVSVIYQDVKLNDDGTITQSTEQCLAWMYVGSEYSLRTMKDRVLVPRGDWARYSHQKRSH